MTAANFTNEELLDWFQKLIRCDHYCPCECHCKDGLPDGITVTDIEIEILKRMFEGSR